MNINPFDELTERYDAWFDRPRGRRVFAVEAHTIRDLLEEMPRPWLEVGVGTGRFAQALGVDDGIDPSPEALKIAAQRRINTQPGYGENLPYPDSTYGTVLMIVTICFLSEPAKALREAGRVLRSNGRLLVGLVPQDSPWGRFYAQKGKEGHPFYSAATFYTCTDVIKMAKSEGFDLERAGSCLFEPPDANVPAYVRSREALDANAGFVGMRFKLSDTKRNIGAALS